MPYHAFLSWWKEPLQIFSLWPGLLILCYQGFLTLALPLQTFIYVTSMWSFMTTLFFVVFQYWGLNSGPTPWVMPPAIFFVMVVFFQTSCIQGWLWTLVLLISAPWVAKITGVSHLASWPPFWQMSNTLHLLWLFLFYNCFSSSLSLHLPYYILCSTYINVFLRQGLAR
jgi:hypothetical protein